MAFLTVVLMEKVKVFDMRFIAPSAKVLIVDDVNTNLKVAEGLMLPYNMHIDLCISGSDAITAVRLNYYDIVLMDNMMPEMDGFEATKQIRAIDVPYSKSVPIIALTANEASGAGEMFLNNGFNDFLSKPIDTSKLNVVLEKWIPKEKQIMITEEKDDTTTHTIEISGIDTARGIAMTGGKVNNYLKTLAIFHKDGLQKINEIKLSLEMDNLHLYTTYVHALKSVLASIGAGELSEAAKALELAGNQKDLAFIKEHNNSFLMNLEVLLANISEIILTVNNEEQSGSADFEIMKSELFRLKSALENLDSVAIDSAVEQLQEYTTVQEFGSVIENILYNTLIGEYDEAMSLIDTITAFPQSVNKFTDMLQSVSELDFDKALSAHGGSEDAYARSIKITVDMLPENIERLNELIESNLPLYAIEVHGIKGVLNNIGAFVLGEKAFELERLSNDGKINECEILHITFIQELTKFSDEMTALLSKSTDVDKSSGNITDFIEVIPRLEAAVESFDHKMALEVMSQVNKFSYEGELNIVLAEMTRAFERFDFDKAEELIINIKSRVNVNE